MDNLGEVAAVLQSTARWILLLRWVNFGAHNKLPMPALREAPGAAGYTDTKTNLQSWECCPDPRRQPVRRPRLNRSLESAGPNSNSTSGVVRSAAQCRPLTNPHAVDDLVQVAFLASVPDPAAEVALIAADWKPDEVSVSGREMLVRCMKSTHESRFQHATILRRLGSRVRPGIGAP